MTRYLSLTATLALSIAAGCGGSPVVRLTMPEPTSGIDNFCITVQKEGGRVVLPVRCEFKQPGYAHRATTIDLNFPESASGNYIVQVGAMKYLSTPQHFYITNEVDIKMPTDMGGNKNIDLNEVDCANSGTKWAAQQIFPKLCEYSAGGPMGAPSGVEAATVDEADAVTVTAVTE